MVSMHVAIHHLTTGCTCYTSGIYTACNIHAERWVVSPVISLPPRCGVGMRAPAVRRVIIRHMWCGIHVCGAQQPGDMVQMLLCHTSDTHMACHIHAKRWAVSPALTRSLRYGVDLRACTGDPPYTTDDDDDNDNYDECVTTTMTTTTNVRIYMAIPIHYEW